MAADVKDVKYARYPIKVNDADKEFVVIRYKEVVADALTAGKTADELKSAVTVKDGEKALPAIAEVKYLATRVCKSGNKYAVIASLRYIG